VVIVSYWAIFARPLFFAIAAVRLTGGTAVHPIRERLALVDSGESASGLKVSL
jgi:hypothetical protein